MVQVPELPEDPSHMPGASHDAGYFEGVAITADDFRRAAQYRANAERDNLKAAATDIEGYLRSLENDPYLVRGLIPSVFRASCSLSTRQINLTL